MKSPLYTALIILSASAAVMPASIAAGVMIHPESESHVRTVSFEGQIAGDGTAGAPAVIDGDELKATFTLVCDSGYFASDVAGYIFYDASEIVRGLGAGFTEVAQGGSTDITVASDMSDLDPDHIYMFVPWSTLEGQLADPVYFRTAEGYDDEQIAYDDGGNIHIYPQGELSSVTITTSDSPFTEVSLYTLDGSYAGGLAVDGHYEVTLDLTDLAHGLYVLEATCADGTVSADKVLRR